MTEFERGITVARNALHQAALERGTEFAFHFFEEYLADDLKRAGLAASLEGTSKQQQDIHEPICPIHHKEKLFCRVCVEKMVEAG